MNKPIGLATIVEPINPSDAYLKKTKRLRRVHFVFADTNDKECNAPINDHTLYTRWAPSVTCRGCRELMINRGITTIDRHPHTYTLKVIFFNREVNRWQDMKKEDIGLDTSKTENFLTFGDTYRSDVLASLVEEKK